MMKIYGFNLVLSQPVYGPCEIKISDKVIGYRPYDGADMDEIADEVKAALADMLAEKLGWPREDPDDEEPAWDRAIKEANADRKFRQMIT